jgi:hypothetical protein
MNGTLALMVGLLAPDAGLSADGGSSAAEMAAAKPAPTGPPPVAQLECAPTPARIGEVVVCTLTVVHRASVSITVTAPEDVVARTPAPAVPHLETMLKTTRDFELRPRSMRKLHVQNLVVIWTESTGGEGRLSIPGQKLAIKSVIGDAREPSFRTFETPGEDIDGFWARHGPLPYPITNWPLIIVLLVLLGGGVGFGVGYLIKRYLDAHRAEPAPWVDPRPAHVIAFEALERLIAEDLPAQGLVKDYYFRLSEIVRGYLERRFGINGLEMTSDEIRAWLPTANFSTEIMLSVDDFLGETDLVKFADFSPDESATETVTRLARGLITLTRSDRESRAEDGDPLIDDMDQVDRDDGSSEGAS